MEPVDVEEYLEELITFTSMSAPTEENMDTLLRRLQALRDLIKEVYGEKDATL